ncbi:YbbR-like domain-containing protein [Aurantibacter sp.]|uniref:YbbR-like domain-containing protein n=1 Tax=Aurantibacter sp. TaxID=2807103 RepID=UPI003262DE2F
MSNFFKNRINKRKAKVFVLFVLASGLIWFLSTLSETYSAKATFKIDYINSNKSLKLKKAFTDRVAVKLKTGGFKFLGFNLQKKAIQLDLAGVQKSNDTYFLAPSDYRAQIEKQLPNSMVLVEMATDTLFFDFLEMTTKEIPIARNIKVGLAHNHMLEGEITIEPSEIKIFGPKDEIDSIEVIHVVDNSLNELAANFNKKVALFKSQELVNTSYSVDVVQVTGKVSKFSERLIDVPIEVINLPEDKLIRTFPDIVSVLCKAKILELKELKVADFKVVADYSKLSSNRSNEMELQLVKKPKEIFSATLMETKVEYILNTQ